MLVVTVSGCSLPPLSAVAGAAQTPDPQQITQQWYDALGNVDAPKMYLLVQPERRHKLEESLNNPVNQAINVFGFQKKQFFELRLSTLSDDGFLARVRVIGKASVISTGAITDIDETIELIKENGRWFIRSAPKWV